jgi:uncharacterized protein
MTSSNTCPATSRRAIRRDIFSGSLESPDKLRLRGSRCAKCAEVTLGQALSCPNCGSTEVSDITLSTHGEVWSYTIIRHRPPGDYLGPGVFEPFGLGLVELAEGIRVLAPISGDVSKLRIGLQVQFRPSLLNSAQGQEVVAFEFAQEGDASHV